MGIYGGIYGTLVPYHKWILHSKQRGIIAKIYIYDEHTIADLSPLLLLHHASEGVH